MTLGDLETQSLLSPSLADIGVVLVVRAKRASDKLRLILVLILSIMPFVCMVIPKCVHATSVCEHPLGDRTPKT